MGDERSLRKGPKGRQQRTTVDDRVQFADSGLKLPFEIPHSDFPKPDSDSPGVLA